MADRDSLHVAVDEFIGMRPEGAEFDEAWFPVRQINHSEPVLPRIVTGIEGEKLPAAVQQRIGDLSAKRLPVIADKVCRATEISDDRTPFWLPEPHRGEGNRIAAGNAPPRDRALR